MKKVTLIPLLSFILICSATAQDNNLAIHVSNPIGMFLKTGLKLEYRVNNIGILVMGRLYYEKPPIIYPGQQAGAAFRYYLQKVELKRHEHFFYTKAIAGHIDYFAGSGSGFTRIPEKQESNYYGFGAGWGKHYNFDYFFIEFNLGLKYIIPEVVQSNGFYATGPGSILDVNLNLGFQF